MSQNSYLRDFSSKESQVLLLSWFDSFTAWLQLYDQKCHKTHISTSSVHKYHKSCS